MRSAQSTKVEPPVNVHPKVLSRGVRPAAPAADGRRRSRQAADDPDSAPDPPGRPREPWTPPRAAGGAVHPPTYRPGRCYRRPRRIRRPPSRSTVSVRVQISARQISGWCRGGRSTRSRTHASIPSPVAISGVGPNGGRAARLGRGAAWQLGARRGVARGGRRLGAARRVRRGVARAAGDSGHGAGPGTQRSEAPVAPRPALRNLGRHRPQAVGQPVTPRARERVDIDHLGRWPLQGHAQQIALARPDPE